MPNKESLSTEQKALNINLDALKYGTVAEIGAGQEVSRILFRVGAAAGTIAKSVSAYDKKVSDTLYGEARRYVSRGRMKQMIDAEYATLVENLREDRPKTTQFFAYAATVTAKSFTQDNECHGWIGIRLQLAPNAEPSDIHVHVRMLDKTNQAQAEALGILGINLIYGAYYLWQNPKQLIESLRDDLDNDRIEVDFINFSGPFFEEYDNRLLNLHLIHSWLTRAVIFTADKNDANDGVAVPSEIFYKKHVMVVRGNFRPVNLVNEDMMHSANQQFSKEIGQDNIVSLAEITVNNITHENSEPDPDGDYLKRVDLLNSLGYSVMISDYVRYFRLRAYLRRYTQKSIGIAISVRNFATLFNTKYYEGLEGGMLEGFGKLFPDNTYVYVYPNIDPKGNLITLKEATVKPSAQPLLDYLKVNNRLKALEKYNTDLMHISGAKIRAGILKGRGQTKDGWESQVSKPIAEQIIDKRLFEYDQQ